MKTLDKLILPDDLKYTASHEWTRVEDNLVVSGISDYAQDQLGDVVFVELPQPGNQIAGGDEFGTVESVKAVAELNMPITGKIVEINEALEENPALVNESPYTDGWMIKFQPDDMAQLDTLMDKDAYTAEIKGS